VPDYSVMTYLQARGIPGTSNDKSRSRWIEVMGFQFFASREPREGRYRLISNLDPTGRKIDPSAGDFVWIPDDRSLVLNRGPVTHSMLFSHAVDESANYFFRYSASGQIVEQMLVNIENKGYAVLGINLKNVAIVSVSSDAETQYVTMHAEKVDVRKW
jgi:type VI protein secretion system component Hcp